MAFICSKVDFVVSLAVYDVEELLVAGYDYGIARDVIAKLRR